MLIPLLIFFICWLRIRDASDTDLAGYPEILMYKKRK
jgi:hypothetical protein